MGRPVVSGYVFWQVRSCVVASSIWAFFGGGAGRLGWVIVALVDASILRPLLTLESLQSPEVAAEVAAGSVLEPELTALAQLHRAGLPVAPLRVVAPSAEEAFYRLNNLPEQLLRCFSGLDLGDPDEDDLELRAPEAQALLKTHYLLDEFVDSFYAALSGLPARVRVRRAVVPGGGSLSGRAVLRGRPALLALKALWADDWSFEALLNRTAETGSVAVQARAVVITAVGQEAADDALVQRAAEVLGQPVKLWLEPARGITGVRLEQLR